MEHTTRKEHGTNGTQFLSWLLLIPPLSTFTVSNQDTFHFLRSAFYFQKNLEWNPFPSYFFSFFRGGKCGCTIQKGGSPRCSVSPRSLDRSRSTTDVKGLNGICREFYHKLDEFCFQHQKENLRCIVPNFINEQFISIMSHRSVTHWPYSLVRESRDHKEFVFFCRSKRAD